jgi:flagellar protein FlaI
VNVAPLVERVRLPPSNNGQEGFGRRIKSIVEIADYEDYRTLCEWNPVEDNFRIDLSDSVHLKKIALRHGLTFVDVLDEVKNRASFLNELMSKGVHKNVELAKQITNYYAQLTHQGVRKK